MLDPPDPELKETLLKYIRLSLTQKQKIERLVKDHNLSIGFVSCRLSTNPRLVDRNLGTTTLNQIERRLEIPSVRRTPAAAEIAAQAVSDEVEKDISQSNGPNYVKARLKDQLIMVKQ